MQYEVTFIYLFLTVNNILWVYHDIFYSDVFLSSFVYEDFVAFHRILLQTSYNNLLYLLPSDFTWVFSISVNLDIEFLGVYKMPITQTGIDKLLPKGAGLIYTTTSSNASLNFSTFLSQVVPDFALSSSCGFYIILYRWY